MVVKPDKKKTSNVVLGTAYEINKNLVEKYEKELTIEEKENKKQEISTFIRDTNNRYYMLLCNDRKDYTIFSLLDGEKDKSEDTAVILVDECLFNRGIVKGIDLTENKDAFEIWLSIDKEAYCYYFFPYDNAIVEV